MENILEKLGLVVLGGLVTGIGYLLKRRIERKPVLDEIEKHQKLLMLNKEMREQRISLPDLKKLEEAILNKEKATERHAISIKKEIKIATEIENREFITQAEMNEHAYEAFKRADEKLKNVIKSLERYLDKTELINLGKVQDAWEVFRKEQAEFSSHEYRGGSIQPLIYYAELERLTVARAASLQSDVDYFASIGR
jgi:uncharacterized protein YecT (DUF1311 family)